MEKTKFKTNIKCAACVEKVTPDLNSAVGEGNWQVDINSIDKILTITGRQDDAKIKQALQKNGYKAEST